MSAGRPIEVPLQSRNHTNAQSLLALELSERYRSGHNGGASKASCLPKAGTWVRIPPSPPSSLPSWFLQSMKCWSVARSKPFQARLLKTGRESTNGLSGKARPRTKLKPSKAWRKPTPGLTWSGCAFGTGRILVYGRILLGPICSRKRHHMPRPTQRLLRGAF